MAKSEIQGFPPRWLTPTPLADIKRGDGEHAIRFIETMCRNTKDSIAAKTGDLLVMRGWQQELIRHLLAKREDGRFTHSEGLILLPRKNGKSALLSALGLYLSFFGVDGGETYVVASSKEQARIVFGDTKKMIQLDPELSELVKIFRDAIEIKGSGTVIRVLAAEAPQLEGLSPTTTIYDELHTAPNDELWNVLALAKASRINSLMVGISTFGVKTDTRGADTLCYSKYQYGKQVAQGNIIDPSFFLAAWEPKSEDSDYLDPKVWAEANPGLGDICSLEDMEISSRRTPAPEFQTKRLNRWVNTINVWINPNDWESCNTQSPIPDGASVVLGFDGSFSGDATAIVAVSIGNSETPPHIDKVAVWERSAHDPLDWRVPVADVENALRAACKRWSVKEIVCDPYRYQRTMQELEAEGLPIVEFPQSPSRMVPATTTFFESVTQNLLTQSGDADLARHIANAHLKTDARGSRLAKESKQSNRKIDLAVAAVMAHSRASFLANQAPTAIPRFYDFDDL